MIHIFKEKNNDKVFITLHGTGSNEQDIMSIGEYIDNDASILSIRGNISENGMNRFFKRYGMGLYDIENYEEETTNLYNAIVKYSKEYNFKLENATIVGFSNGANIALGLIQDYPKLLNNYILLSPDYINKEKDMLDLSNLNVYISTSKNDPYCDYNNIIRLKNDLENKNANVTEYLGFGHQVNYEILNDVKKWLNK